MDGKVRVLFYLTCFLQLMFVIKSLLHLFYNKTCCIIRVLAIR